jgi:hypothetical protein
MLNYRKSDPPIYCDGTNKISKRMSGPLLFPLHAWMTTWVMSAQLHPCLRRATRYISQTMASASTSSEQPGRSSAVKLSVEDALRLAGLRPLPPQPLPVSRFSQWFQRRAQRPTCTHTTMTRVYNHSLCEVCGSLGPMGWLYCCTQDTDEVIRAEHDLGFDVSASAIASLTASRNS